MHHRHKQQGGLQGAGEDEGGGASRSGSTRALRQAVSAVAGEQAQGDRKGEEEEGVTSPSASSGKTDKRGTSCLNCRTSKVGAVRGTICTGLNMSVQSGLIPGFMHVG